MFFKLLFCLLNLAFLAASQDYDFFYLVQQWPGAYCDTSKSCCYPSTGKPSAAFSIHGLWPNYYNGSYPSNCDPGNPFDPTLVSDLTPVLQKKWPSLACPSDSGERFWKHEWDKHGTCSILDQRGYFSATLKLQQKVNIVEILAAAGIKPDGGMYSLRSIKGAIKGSTGLTPWLGCNTDTSGNSQLYEVYLCVEASGSDFIECPVFPNGRCSSFVEFQSF